MIERRLLELIIRRFLGSSNRRVTGTGEYRTEYKCRVRFIEQASIALSINVGLGLLNKGHPLMT